MPNSSSTAKPVFKAVTGVDIAYLDFTAYCTKAEPKAKSQTPTFKQTEAGHTSFLDFLQAKEVPPAHHLVVMEATGAYWIALAVRLHEAGFAVAVVNPAQAHYFAKARLQRAKNDALDARMLAEMGQALDLTRWTPPPQIYHELRQRFSQRDNLLKLKNQVQNQLHALSLNPVVIESVRNQQETLIATLATQIAEMEQEIKKLLEATNEWSKNIALLQTIPGLGLLTALWLVLVTLNFTLCDTPEALVRYAGLAPMESSSGTSLRRRPTIGHSGNHRLRTLLFLGTLTSVRFNPTIKAFWQRLRVEKKKPVKVARCACARKMVHLAFAVVKSGKPYSPQYLIVKEAAA